MRSLLFLLFFIPLTYSSFAQDSEVETYLIIRIQRQNDKGNPYYIIDAEPYNNNALDIYELEPFVKNYFIPKKGISFYYNRPDTLTPYYNYFKSETEALDFMGSKQWQLVTVVSELSSDMGTSMLGTDRTPYTSITSRRVYYFRKKVVPVASLVQ